MTECEVMPNLPTSGQILGALVGRLGVKHRTLRDRTARRYFAADPERLVKDSSRERIIGAIAEVLTDSGLVASPQMREVNYPLAPTFASMLLWHAHHWDLVRSFMRRRTMKVLPSNLPKVWEAYVRLASIDLALRVAAHLHLAGSSPAALDFLVSATLATRGDYLNERRQRAGLTLEELAVEVAVDDHSVDAWMYHGARPSNDNLTKTGEVLAERVEGLNASDIALELRSLYWVSDVAGMLAEHIGDEAVEDAIGRLHKYTEAVYRIIKDRFPAKARGEELTVLADMGVGARNASPLLATLIGDEPDEEWRKDLRSTGTDWILRVLSANLHAHLAGDDDLINPDPPPNCRVSVAALREAPAPTDTAIKLLGGEFGIKKADGPSLDDGEAGNPEAYSHYRLSLELKMEGRPHEAVAEMEKAIKLAPMDARYHHAMGSMKTGAAMWTGRTPLVDEGLNSLWMAVELAPNWILPWTEIGATLHFTGRSEEAVEHLIHVSAERGPLDSDYHSALGAAYWKVGKLAEALTAFEASLELDPDETSALLAASELALLVGDNRKQRKYMRIAKHFGAEPDTLKFWELLREFGQEG